MSPDPAVLLVNAECDFTDRLSAALREALPRVATVVAQSAYEASIRVRTRKYDGIVIGPSLPDESPLELVRKIRNEDVLCSIIIVSDRNLNGLSEVIDNDDNLMAVPLGDTAIKAITTRLSQVCSSTPLDRHLTLRKTSRRNVDLIKITAGTLYHEISNPLMTILGMTELILDNGHGDDKELVRKIEAIRESAGRIQATLRRLINIDEPAIRDTVSGRLIDPERSRLNHKLLP